MLPFAWSNGAAVTNDDGTEYTLDSPQMNEALEYYKSFFDEGYSPTRLLDPGELETGFAKGSYGAFISGPWHIGPGRGRRRHARQVRRGPAARQGRRSGHVVHRRWRPRGLQGLRQPRRRLEARAVALASPRSSRSGTTTIERPAGREVRVGHRELAAATRSSQVFGEQLESASPRRPCPRWEQVAAVIDSDVEKAVKGATPVADAVEDMQTKAKSIGTGL